MIRTSLVRLLPLLLALIILSGGCQPAAVPDAVDPASSLRVGISAHAPPFAFRQGGEITGLEPAFARKLGDYLGKTVQFVEIPWGQQIEYLTTGKTDIIMSGMTITEARSTLVDFSLPYLRSGQILLVRMEDRRRFATGLESLMNTNYRIGTVADTVSDFLITTAINDANEIVFKTSQEAVDALINNEIDAFVYDAPIVCYYAARHQNDKLAPVLTMATEEYIGWALRKGDTELLTKVNEFLDSLKNEGKLQEEIQYWIPYLYR
ncbi:MAG: transporter substrate-binding domain-containing protein [Desulfofustis sp.]|nr:transporter substrate-binding domain-containing protein [Desulfofustis sp.]NNK58170.1 transporter substrate-binding domain-containing protein [Desulfofustis sp.]